MAWLLLGAALDRVARYEEAEDVLREGLERHPDFHELRGKLAQVLYIQWKFEEARQQWALVLQSNPSAPDAYEGLPSMSIWEGDQAQARSLIEESIRRNPDPVLSMDLASILSQRAALRLKYFFTTQPRQRVFVEILSRISFSRCFFRRQIQRHRLGKWNWNAIIGIAGPQQRWNGTNPSTGND